MVQMSSVLDMDATELGGSGMLHLLSPDLTGRLRFNIGMCTSAAIKLSMAAF
jgi:hypothetical protein